jgi:hypothetical protein
VAARQGDSFFSVVVSRLKEIDSLGGNAVHKAVFLGNPPRPTTGQHIFQWLWLSRPQEGIAHDGLYKVEHSKSDSTLCLHPKSEIFEKLGLKNSSASRRPLHPTSLSAMRQVSLASTFVLLRGEEQ